MTAAANEIRGYKVSDMESIGETLSEARQAKRASLEDASRATKIKIEILEQLEADEFDRLAAPTYTKGFPETLRGIPGTRRPIDGGRLCAQPGWIAAGRAAVGDGESHPRAQTEGIAVTPPQCGSGGCGIDDCGICRSIGEESVLAAHFAVDAVGGSNASGERTQYTEGGFRRVLPAQSQTCAGVGAGASVGCGLQSRLVAGSIPST
jgi:hypothetical protein